jgi:hypothetical protein
LHYQNNEEPVYNFLCLSYEKYSRWFRNTPRRLSHKIKSFTPTTCFWGFVTPPPIQKPSQNLGKRTFSSMRFRSPFFLRQVQFLEAHYIYMLYAMAGLGTDDRRSAQPLAPREKLRFTYFLLWDWSAQKSPDESVVPQDDFRKKIKSFIPKTRFWGPGWLW